MRSQRKSSIELKHEVTNDGDAIMSELKKSTFDPFCHSNIDIRQVKKNNPIKIQCPLKNRTILNWSILIDEYFDYLTLYDHPNFSATFYQRMLSLSEAPNKREIIEYVQEKIDRLIDQIMNELLSQKTLTNFYGKIEKIQANLKNLNTIFDQLCGDVTYLVISNIRNHLSNENIRKFRDIIQSIINEFSENDDSEIVILIIQFFTQFDLLTKEIKDHFSSTFINTLNSISKKSKDSPFQSTAKLYCKLCQVFPIGETSILERTIGPYLKNIVKMDLQSFVNEIIPNIGDYFEDIYNFIYSTEEAEKLTHYFIGYYNNNPKRMIFDEVCSQFRMFKHFSTEIKFKLAEALRKSLPRNDESVAIRYAELLDKSFRNESISNEYKRIEYDMIEMYLIQNRDVFECSHIAHMLRRSLETSMIPDQQFVEKYKLLFGEYSVTGFESVLNDYKESTQLSDEFKLTNEVPPFLNIFAFYSCNWSRKYQRLSIIPEVVREHLENFSKFYKEKRPRRFIEWSPLLSNCILEINGVTIKCNGLTASILYALQNGPKTSDEISREIFFDDNEVEVVLNSLKTNNYGKLILMNNDQYSLNPKPTPENNFINLPLFTPKDSKSEERKEKIAIMTSRERQIEAAILLCLKKDTTIKENDLFQKSQQKLKFNLEYYLFEEKLKTLSERRFLKRDINDCTVTYIP